MTQVPSTMCGCVMSTRGGGDDGDAVLVLWWCVCGEGKGVLPGFCREFARGGCWEFAGGLPGVCRGFAGSLPGVCRVNEALERGWATCERHRIKRLSMKYHHKLFSVKCYVYYYISLQMSNWVMVWKNLWWKKVACVETTTLIHASIFPLLPQEEQERE